MTLLFPVFSLSFQLITVHGELSRVKKALRIKMPSLLLSVPDT